MSVDVRCLLIEPVGPEDIDQLFGVRTDTAGTVAVVQIATVDAKGCASLCSLTREDATRLLERLRAVLGTEAAP